MSAVDKELKAEFDFYLTQPEDWKGQNRGKFVVIKDRKIDKVFENYTDAFKHALEKFGDAKFLIQEVGAEDRVAYTTQSLLGIT